MRTLARSGPSNISTAGQPSSQTALRRSGEPRGLAEEYPDGWVYIHVDYRGDKG